MEGEEGRWIKPKGQDGSYCSTSSAVAFVCLFPQNMGMLCTSGLTAQLVWGYVNREQVGNLSLFQCGAKSHRKGPSWSFFPFYFLAIIKTFKHTQYTESGIMNPQHPFGLDGFIYDHFTSVHSTTGNKWIASSFGLLWTKSLWPSLHMAYVGHKHSFPQAAYWGMKLWS